MRVLIAPDKFRGTLTAIEAAATMARGVRALSDLVEPIEFPMADGGDGTVDVLSSHVEVSRLKRMVHGPLGDPVDATFGVHHEVAWIEMAACSGLHLCDELRPLEANSRGTGDMTRGATQLPSVRRAVVAVGGSASTDGGTGAARAHGWRFLDGRGGDLPLGGAALVDLAHIDIGVSPPIEIIGACDVDSPLLGDSGAARSFAAQKGASDDEIERLEEGLWVLARVVESDIGMTLDDLPHAGAGGGMGAGLLAFFDASLGYGFDLISETVDLGSALAQCDVVVTGEGAYDEQSSRGKVAHRVAEAAAALEIPCVLIAGELRSEPDQMFGRSVDVSQTYGNEQARYEAASSVAKATMEGLAPFL
jgi:glycerate kinase